MKGSFYRRLAFVGIRKNRKLYLPYLLTCIGMVTVFYILSALAGSKTVKAISGGPALCVILQLGTWVIGIFSLIFLSYTDSFLMRRRSREFGLYNILGMDKGNLSYLMVTESLLLSGSALIAGLGLGVLFSKLFEMGMFLLVNRSAKPGLTVSVPSLILTAAVYGAVFLLICLKNIVRVRKSGPLELMSGEKAGEKPPKANWAAALLGVILLGLAYWISLTIQNPLDALVYFFFAVVLVIIATYLLMTAGSVTLCRVLQKNKKFYYKKRHFVSLSSMAYRMKRNGMGLASICILSTMVLVTATTTFDLFVGTEDAVMLYYPHEQNIVANFETAEDTRTENITRLRETVRQAVDGHSVQQFSDYVCLSVFGKYGDGVLYNRSTSVNQRLKKGETLLNVQVIPMEDYRKATGDTRTLGENEMLYALKSSKLSIDTLQIGVSSLTLKSVDRVKPVKAFGEEPGESAPTLYVFVENFEKYGKAVLLENAKAQSSKAVGEAYYIPSLIYRCGVDTGEAAEQQKELGQKLEATFEKENGMQYRSLVCQTRADHRDDFYAIYGGMFFIGTVLSAVFICAAVLMIYYKQICEGYEDCGRFEIMQKVGMTHRDIRKSVNSQILTVFFAPLVLSGIHLGFAFPMLWKMLQLFHFYNRDLILSVTVCGFLVFAVLYGLVYLVTSNAYYRIVSSKSSQ